MVAPAGNKRSPEELADRDQDLGDQVGSRCGAWVVDVVFDVEVVANGELLVFDHIEDAARGFGEIVVGPGEGEAGVFAAGEFGVLEASGEILGFGSEADSGAIDHRSYLIETAVGGDLVVFADGGDDFVKLFPGLRGIVLKWTDFFDVHVMGFGPSDGFGLAGQIERGFWGGHVVSLRAGISVWRTSIVDCK